MKPADNNPPPGPAGARSELAPGVSITTAALTSPARALLVPAIIAIIARLHRQFDGPRRALLAARHERQQAFDSGRLPAFEPSDSPAVRGDWRVAPVPADLRRRRVEITGPVNSTKMVVNMLSRNSEGVRADAAMLDFEDSMKPSWDNVIAGLHNVIGAASGTLRFSAPEKEYRLDPQDMPIVMVRTRGLHLAESNFLVDGQPVSAGLFDLAASFFHAAPRLLARGLTPKFYIPKTEHHLEARWWNDLFVAVQEACDVPAGTLRATFLIETLPAAFQIEEILHEIRAHAAGLNVGRWDKIFSDIKVLKNHPDRLTADRATINMEKPWMKNYAQRLVKICHERGAYAIGGMSAFTPGKTPEARAAQTAKVCADKANECRLGHDGCWVSHPYFIGPALAQFPHDEQLDRLEADFDRYPDLLPRGETARTLAGLRTNIRVGIAYQHGWNQDIGCVSWDGLMEDLATFEISRAQTWQWLRHEAPLTDGTVITPALVEKVFAEELARILDELPPEQASVPATGAAYRQAAADARRIFLHPTLADYLSLASDIVTTP